MKKIILFLLFVTFASWSFGQRILFVSEVAGQADLYLSEEDGSSLKRITNTPDYELSASVSPDGRRIAFAASPLKEGKFQRPQIFFADINGNVISQITHDKKSNFSPSFSPDAQKIAFSSRDDDQDSDIYIIDIDGKNLKQMTSSPMSEANPAWGVGGATLLYQAGQEGQSKVMKMGVKGIAGFETLETGNSFSPDWGPQAKTFVYALQLSGSPGVDLLVSDSEGKTIKRIASENIIRSHPHLSRDGQKVVYEQNNVERSGVYVSDLEGNNVVQIGIAENHNFAPVWVGSVFKKNKKSPSNSSSQVINDDLGSVIKINPDKLPQKVVSLSPAITEIIFALGGNERLKGVTLRANYPAEAKLIPQVGSFGAPDWEKIKQIAPQYVFLSSSLQEKFVSQIKSLGAVPVLFKPKNIEETFHSFNKISLILTGEDKKAVAVITPIRKRLAAVEAILRNVEQPRRVYLEVNGPKNLYTVGKNSFMHDLMTKAGVVNVFGDREEGYPKLTDEEVFTANPDVIIIDHPLQFKKGVGKRPGWSRIEAVKEGRVYDGQDFDTLILDRPGPRIAEAVEIIARLTYSELFNR